MNTSGIIRKAPSAVLAAALVLLCASCIMLPVVTPSPFGPEILQTLSAPDADRTLARRLLGEPAQIKARGEYWFYKHTRTQGIFIAGTRSGELVATEWLGIRFDQSDKIIFIERAEFPNCLSNGMCLDGTAPATVDQFARQYQPQPDECAVYLYLDALPWPLMTGMVAFWVDGARIGTVNKDTYLLLTHAPGNIEIAAYDLKISARCIGGERLYVQAIKKKDTSWLTGEDLAPQSPATGADAVGKRRAALHD